MRHFKEINNKRLFTVHLQIFQEDGHKNDAGMKAKDKKRMVVCLVYVANCGKI